MTPPAALVNDESTSGGEATAVFAIDVARADGDARNRRVAENVGDGGADAGRMPSPPASPTALGLGAYAGQAPNPQASLPVGAGPGAEEEAHAPKPPVVMA